MTGDDKMMPTKSEPQIQKCICGYETKHRQCLHRHKKTCSLIKKQEINSEINVSSVKDKEIEIEMLREQLSNFKNENDMLIAFEKENEKLKMQIQGKDEMIQGKDEMIQGKDEMIELLKTQLENQNEIIKQLSLKQHPHQIIDASHNTVNHNKFNLNFYLNDKCKNAISFEKFINDFTVSPELFDNFIVPEKIDADVHKTKIFGDLFHKNMCKYPQIEIPIQTNDKIRNHFHYKANGEWVNSQEDIATFNKFLNNIELNKMMKPAKEYENAKKINGNDASETKFDNIKIGLFSDLNKDKFINSFIPKYAVDKQ